MRTHTRFWTGLLAATLTVLLGAVLGWSGQALAGSQRGTTTEPAGDTVVRVIGDAANGFGIKHYDGSWVFPPTDSEAHAACAEPERKFVRVRCHTRVRRYHRDLADMQQALAWARQRSR